MSSGPAAMVPQQEPTSLVSPTLQGLASCQMSRGNQRSCSAKTRTTRALGGGLDEPESKLTRRGLG